MRGARCPWKLNSGTLFPWYTDLHNDFTLSDEDIRKKLYILEVVMMGAMIYNNLNVRSAI